MASVKVILYKSKTYKDGTHPLMLQIIHNRKVKKQSINIRLLEEDWDSANNLPKRRVSNYKEIVTLIRTKIIEAEKTLVSLETSKNNFSVNELATKIKGKKSKKSFNEYTEELIEGMIKANKIGNANSYQGALNIINKFTNNKDLAFTDIDYKFLTKFEEFHLRKEGNTINGLNVYMRVIRAVYNKAINEDLVSVDFYPFRKYKIKIKKTAKRAISRDEMKRIVKLKLDETSTFWNARNYFLFSFYTIGMSWIDMALLKVENIKGDRIIYQRSKTDKEYNVKINENISDILKYYIKGKQQEDYIFPIIHDDENETIKRKNIKNALRIYNKHLKQIGEMINCSIPLTSYVSRHSWASIANFSGIHIGVISQGLGHEDIKTTQTYLANFDYSAIDEANNNIL